MMDFQMLPNGICMLRFSGQDAECLRKLLAANPENRMTSLLVIGIGGIAPGQLNPRSAYELLQGEAEYIYNLFFRYWNPSRQPTVNRLLKDLLAARRIEVYHDARTGQRHVSIEGYRGQKQFVMLLLENMSDALRRQLRDTKVLTRLCHDLAANLEYHRASISPKSMRTTLLRAVNEIMEKESNTKGGPAE